MSEILLVSVIAAVVALIALGFLWQRERRRAEYLEAELAHERAKRTEPRVNALTPLFAVLQTAATRTRRRPGAGAPELV